MKKLQFPLNQIVEVFNQIKSRDIILMAKKIQKRLITDKSLIKKDNDKYKIVTQVDIEIQKYLLNYFKKSLLKGTYEIVAEEKFVKQINKDTTWKLIIDPLDGTSSFKNQKNTWGVMIGACDISGILQYSYNIISSGKVYKSENNKKFKLKSFEQLKKTGKNITIDIYDYDSGFSNLIDDEYKKTSYPAAIWAGWQIYQQKLNGLLWLPSNRGKKYYPDYDLIFLKALEDKGYKILLGKIENNNALIAVAPTKKDVEKLYQIGTNLIPKQLKTKMIKTTNLSIINS